MVKLCQKGLLSFAKVRFKYVSVEWILHKIIIIILNITANYAGSEGLLIVLHQ